MVDRPNRTLGDRALDLVDSKIHLQLVDLAVDNNKTMQEINKMRFKVW